MAAAVPLPPSTNHWIGWEFHPNDHINNVETVFDTSRQIFLVRWWRLERRTLLTDPWSFYCLTNRPPVWVNPTNQSGFFRLGNTYLP